MSDMPPPEPQPTPELFELIRFALDHGIESVKGSGPLIPFLLSTGTGRPTLQRFVADSLDRSREMVQEAADKLAADVERYAIAIDGYLRSETGERQDAILVEAGQRGEPRAFLFAQRYQPKDVTQDLQVLGEPALVGESENRLG
jgi:hypothetical protein